MDQISQNPPQAAVSAQTSANGQPSPQQPTVQAASIATPTTPAVFCKCPTINEAEWENQKKVLTKTFYKTFSPRLFNIPFSFAIDLDRAKKAATKAGYQIPENPMILTTGNLFWGSILVEVTGAKPDDKNTATLNQEVYTKVSKGDFKNINIDLIALKKVLGQSPEKVYCWYTSCPKCKDTKTVKAVLIAPMPKSTAAPQAPASQQPSSPAPSTLSQPTSQPSAPAPQQPAPPVQTSTSPPSQSSQSPTQPSTTAQPPATPPSPPPPAQ